VLMPTASGRLESAKYGSTRTIQRGSRFVASFHEAWNCAGRARPAGIATDPVVAVGGRARGLRQFQRRGVQLRQVCGD
jgi:hypothetical protein